jgi:hypothetical protein
VGGVLSPTLRIQFPIQLVDGEPFIRYCFEREADAEAFHALFASVAEKAIYKKAG